MKRTITLFAIMAALSLVFVGCKKKPKNEEKAGGDTMEAMAETMEAMAETMEAKDMAAMDMAAMDMEAMDMAAMDMEAMDMDAMAAAGDGALGVKECDEYIKVYKCYLSKMPAAQKTAVQAAFDKTIKAWKDALAKAMGTPQIKEATAKGCKMALDTFKKTAAKTPYGKECLK